MEDFLTERQQLVTVGSSRSNWGKVISGMPQGLVLGPILFLLYVNGIPSEIRRNIKVFADDTKIYRAVLNNMECAELQEYLTRLELWARDWLYLTTWNVQSCKNT